MSRNHPSQTEKTLQAINRRLLAEQRRAEETANEQAPMPPGRRG